MFNFLSLKKDPFALDISELSFKIIKLEKNRKNFKLVSFGEFIIPEGIIKDGEIKNEDTLSNIIKESIKNIKGEKIKTKYVTVSLPEQKSFLQVIKLPKMNKQELRKAVKFEAENYIPLPLNEVYLDFQVIKPAKRDVGHYNILIAALPKKIIDSYVSSIKKAGLMPVALEIESQATSRALIKNKISNNPVLLIDLGATGTSFIIFSGLAVCFTTSIPISSHDFTKNIAKNLKIDLEKAEKMKRDYGLEICQKITFRKKVKSIKFEKEFVEDKRILKSLAPSIINLTKEIKKYLNYCETHKVYNFNNSKVEEIILCGGGANLKGLGKVLSLELGIPTVVGNPWINVFPGDHKEIKGLSFKKSLSYTTAIGLALRDIN